MVKSIYLTLLDVYFILSKLIMSLWPNLYISVLKNN